jgi:hypothetical protein
MSDRLLGAWRNICFFVKKRQRRLRFLQIGLPNITLNNDSFGGKDTLMFLYLKKFVIGMANVIKLKARRLKFELSLQFRFFYVEFP